MMNLNYPSFWRMPESSQNNYLLDAGFHQHDENVFLSTLFLILR